jgi:hypothetical protein
MTNMKIQRLKVRFRKIKNSISNRILQSTNEPLTDIQKTAFQTCKKMICNKGSDLIYAPLTSTYFVEKSHYYVRIQGTQITITNGKFSYFVVLPAHMSIELIRLFDRISQTKSNRLEQKYGKATLSNLSEICATINSI